MLICWALGSIIGATALNFLPFLPNIELVTILCLLYLISITFCWHFVNQSILGRLLILGLAIFLSLSWSTFCAYKKLSWNLPLSDQNRLIQIEGKVKGLCHTSATGKSFTLALEKYQGKKISGPIQVRLFWQDTTRSLHSGDRILCQAKLKRPWHLSNPGGMDQEKKYFVAGIRATGKVVNLIHHQAIKDYSLTRLRQHCQEKIYLVLKDKPFIGVIQALTLGITTMMTNEQWQVFQETGTAHVIAISGTHVGLVAIFFYQLMTKITSHFVRLTTYFPAKCYGAVFGMIAAILYSGLAGFSIPTQRACVMIVMAMMAILRRQSLLSWDLLALSWIGVYLLDPLAPLQKGFWLSFGCVAALIFGCRSFSHLTRVLRWWQPQWITFIAMLPLGGLFFQQIPVFACLANLFLLPIMSMIIIPLSLLGLISTVCLKLAHFSLTLVWPFLENIVHWPYHLWLLTKPPIIHLILALISVIILLAPKALPARYLAWIGFLPMFLYHGSELKNGECRFTLLDVGQGLAAVIQTQHHTVLYDAGPQYGKEEEAGSKVIRPFLRFSHIKKLDKVIISHSDLDHRAGLRGLKDFPIDDLITSEPLRLKEKARMCQANESWQWDGVTFTLLNPLSTQIKNRNNLSCVLKIATAAHSVLLTGDIEKAAEAKMVQYQPASLKSDILVVPHHGSLTSSTESFITQVAPQYALYPVGLDNHYGFPKQAVLQRYEAIGAKNLLVSLSGALIFELKTKGKLLSPIQWREKSQRFWNTVNSDK